MRVPSRRSRTIRVSAALAAGFLIVAAGVAAATSSVLADPLATATGDREGPQLYAGSVIDVTGTVDGDVYAAGQSVTISGDVTGDVIAAAQTIRITGTVEGNVRLAGQDIVIDGDVGRSGTALGATVTLSDTGSIGEDLVSSGGDIRITGELGRNLVASSGNLTIDGTVGGDVTYTSDNDARITDGAVSGSVTQLQPERKQPMEVSPWAVFIGWALGVLYALVALSLITLFAGLLIPRVLERVTDRLMPSPWKALLVGFVACLVVPATLLVLLITIVGAPLALVGLLVWGVMVFSTFLYGSSYLGRLLFRGRVHPVVKSLVGGVILIVALQVPWLNILVWLAMVLFGVGAQLLEIQRRRPWIMRPTLDGPPAPIPTMDPHPAGPAGAPTVGTGAPSAADGAAATKSRPQNAGTDTPTGGTA